MQQVELRTILEAETYVSTKCHNTCERDILRIKFSVACDFNLMARISNI